MPARWISDRTYRINHFLNTLATGPFVDIAENEGHRHQHVCQYVTPTLHSWNEAELEYLLTDTLERKGVCDELDDCYFTLLEAEDESHGSCQNRNDSCSRF